MIHLFLVNPLPLHVGMGFRIRLDISSPDIVDGATYRLVCTGTTPGSVTIDHDLATVPMGSAASGAPIELFFESTTGCSVPDRYQLTVHDLSDPLTTIVDGYIDVIAVPAGAGTGGRGRGAGGRGAGSAGAGSAGARGPRGPRGPAGADGVAGPPGADGADARTTDHHWVFTGLKWIGGLALLVLVTWFCLTVIGMAISWSVHMIDTIATSSATSNTSSDASSTPTTPNQSTPTTTAGPSVNVNGVCTSNCTAGNTNIGWPGSSSAVIPPVPLPPHSGGLLIPPS